MSGWERRDPEEQQRRQAHANELMLLVAARLLGGARLAGAFPTDEALGAFATRLGPELESDEHLLVGDEDWVDLPRVDYKLTIRNPEPDAVHLGCHYGNHSLFERLRIDGVLDEGGVGVGVSFDDPESRVEMTPRQAKMVRQFFDRRESGLAETLRPTVFRGEEFDRAVAPLPHRDATIQILAVELYDDGLIVRYTHEGETEDWTTHIAAIEDDLGTLYDFSGEGSRGIQVVHAEACFTPAVPVAATRLAISTYAGEVTVELSV